MKATTTRTIALLVIVDFTFYFLITIATKGIHSIPMGVWLIYIVDFILDVLILYQVHRRLKKQKNSTNHQKETNT
jgi:Na+-driven multidrug efflux pump